MGCSEAFSEPSQYPTFKRFHKTLIFNFICQIKLLSISMIIYVLCTYNKNKDMKSLIYELYSIIVCSYLYFVLIEEKIFFPKKKYKRDSIRNISSYFQSQSKIKIRQRMITHDRDLYFLWLKLFFWWYIAIYVVIYRPCQIAYQIFLVLWFILRLEFS